MDYQVRNKKIRVIHFNMSSYLLDFVTANPFFHNHLKEKNSKRTNDRPSTLFLKTRVHLTPQKNSTMQRNGLIDLYRKLVNMFLNVRT